MIRIRNQQFDLLIDGKIGASFGKKYFDAINPSTGETFSQIADAAREDIDKALQSARKAFDSGFWSRMQVAERGVYLRKIADYIRKNAKELADLETFDVGKTIKQSTFIDVPTAADTFEYFGHINEVLREYKNKISAPVESLVFREPVGVVACIIPWNYPLIMAAWKIAPALIAGNTVVFKPSRLASCAVMKLAQLFKQCDFPEGVINVVSTTDHEALDMLVEDPRVDMISFTGGTDTGEKIMAAAAKTTKKLSMELGGKSPNIVFADCDMEAAVGGAMSAIFMNQGQMCTAGSRLLLENKIYDEFLERLIGKTKTLRIGDSSDYTTSFGPVITKEHRDHILELIKLGVLEGARIVCGGKVPEGMEEKGFYIEPTILVNVDNTMKVAREEIFGPVLCVMKFSEVEEALEIANDSAFGLAACIWTRDLDKAHQVAKRLQCGTVWINTYGGFYNEAPYGGYKRSGFGRELGLEGLLEFTQTKHICTDKTPNGKPLVASWF